jgi:alpha-L-fucosidase
MKKEIIVLALILFSFFPELKPQTYEPNWNSLDKRPIPQWFTDAKFGIFIHWGVYSVPAWAPASADIGVYAKYAEWYWQRINGGKDPNPQKTDVNQLFIDYHNKVWGKEFKYQDFAPLWKAQQFNPDQWAEVFSKSGAKYVILTSKHHEGFTLWPSEQSWNWNSVDIGPHRDLVGDLSTAVKAKGLHMGLYYSLYEWFNPLYKSNPEKYVSEHMIPQMKDLVTRYQPDILYPDGEWDYPSSLWQSENFLSWLYNESPVKSSVVVNDRWGKETRSKHGGYYSSEYGNVGGEEKAGDMSAHPWEEIRGIGTSFGYNRIEDLSHYLSSEELVHMLVKIVSEGGNLCLNIGPTADGLIPVIMQQRLLDMGRWLEVNGEGIYGTKVWSKRPAATENQSVFFTSKGKDIYVICTKWPEKDILVEGLKKSGKVSLLGSKILVSGEFSKGKLYISAPEINPGNIPCEYAWVFKIADCNP